MPFTFDEKSRLFAKLEANGWTWRGDSIFAPHGGYWIPAEVPWPRGGVANFRQAMTWGATGEDRKSLVRCLDELWREMTVDIRLATQDYESWLRDEWIELIHDELQLKHERMAEDVFTFLLATYYRWEQRWPALCPELAAAPDVLCVGDLHVENFGTWRDVEGRLIWGIHNLDEAYFLPYTNDLLRLATSACLATREAKLSISAKDACDAILKGYRNSLAQGGCPVVLAGRNRELWQMVEYVHKRANFWTTLDQLPTVSEPLPERAATMIELWMPEPATDFRVVHRVGGVGSFGRRRFLALANWRDQRIAIEAKEIPPPAHYWARPDQKQEIFCSNFYRRITSNAVRVRDPWVQPEGNKYPPDWLVRRLGPDRGRIELASLPNGRDERILLELMGHETANVHLGTRRPIPAVRSLANAYFEMRRAKTGIIADLLARGPNWLERGANAMARSVEEDWRDWKER